MKILMLTWEFPPLIAGGLGMACYGMVRSLLKMGVEIDLILPAKHEVYFPLRKVEDVDLLPVKFFDQKLDREFRKKFSADSTPKTYTSTSQKVFERLEQIGIEEHPETYVNGRDLQQFESLIRNKHHKISYFYSKLFPYHSTVKHNELEDFSNEETNVFQNIRDYLTGDENTFKKVQEFTFRAARMAQSLDFDMIHAHDWLTYSAGMLIKKATSKPLVAHMHATEFDRAGGAGDERIHKLEFSGMSYADLVIVVSKYTSQMVVTRYRIDTGKIRIVHNAHVSKTIAIDQSEKKLFKGPTILFLGRITIQKGPDYFLDVAKLVLQKHPKATFIMAGTGDMSRKLLHKSAEYRLRNRFLFTGFLNRQEVEMILSNTDIYVLPSVSEPFGIAPLEAMAYGITAIISKQSGVSEVIENAYKVDFWDISKMAETICYLIDNPSICNELGQKGMEEVEKIRWDSAAEKIVEIYKEAKSL